MKICAVFDMDGTLIRSAGDISNAINRMRLSFGLPALPHDAAVHMVGNGARVLVQRALADAPALDHEEALRRYRAAYDAHLTDETQFYPGVLDGLRVLAAAGAGLAVFTNKPHNSTLQILRTLGGADLFSSVIGADSGFPLKPAPDALLHILKSLGASPLDSWMIGDNWTDLDAGHAAGMKTAYCAYGYGHPDKHAPDVSCANFSDIISAVLDSETATK